MMKRVITLLLMCLPLLGLHAQDSWQTAEDRGRGTLKVFIQEEHPFAFYEDGEFQGIEVDILRKFADWVYSRHGVHLSIEFKRYRQFMNLYEDVMENENVVGAAFVTIDDLRSKEVQFTPTYLQNASVLVSPVATPTMAGFRDFERIFGEKTALVIRGTTHERRLMEIRDEYNEGMRVKYVEEPEQMLPHLLGEDHQYYAMVDLITFWRFVKANNGGLKIHRAATVSQEQYGFVLPHGSDWYELFEAFFNEGFGFTASEDYENILRKYLGEEVVPAVMVK